MNGVFWLSYLALWAIVLLQAYSLLDSRGKIIRLHRSLGALQGAVVVENTALEGRELPPLRGIRALDGQSASWAKLLPDGYGTVVRLHAKCETCAPLAEGLRSIRLEPLVILLEGSHSEVRKFFRETGLDARHVVFIDQASDTVASLGLTWTPAVLAVNDGRRGKAAQVRNVNDLKTFIDKEVVASRDKSGLQD